LRDALLSASKLEDFSAERAAPRRRVAASANASANSFANAATNALPEPPRTQKKKRSLLARVFGPQKMGVILLLGIGGLAFVGVPMNALFLQDGRHPAPLFSTSTPLPAREDQAAAPTPPTRPPQLQAARVEAEGARPESAPSRPAPKSVSKNDAALKAEIMKSEPPAMAKADKKRDPISQLLGGGGEAAAETPDKSVLYVQRALQKLGYVVKPDGVLGGGTRQAIEKFERENGLPAKGDPSPKVVKLLAARSGLARQ
jgi:hypothetical protein